MITVARENIQTVIDNFSLVEEHWSEVVQDKDARKLDVHWDFFKKAEQSNSLVVYVARDDGQVIGYAVWLLQFHLHCRTLLTAHNDAVFVSKGKRAFGAGIKLLRHCDSELPKLGVNMIFFHVKPSVDFSGSLIKMGYRYHEGIYTRSIGE